MNLRKDFLKSMKSKNKESDMSDLDGKLGSLKKVTIASDSSEGLSKGLDKAEQLLKSRSGLLPKIDDKIEAKESPLMEEGNDFLGEEMPEAPADETVEAKFELLKDLSKEDMEKCIEFLQHMIAGKDLKEEASSDEESEFDPNHVF